MSSPRQRLTELSGRRLELFATWLSQSPGRWEQLVRHNPQERVYELIWDSPQVNAWLICWSEGQDTGFHDHDGSAAAITVISGQLREERLRIGAPSDVRDLAAGATVRLEPTAIHRVRQLSSGTAVSIHAYSPPLRRSGAYQVGADGTLERRSQSFEHELRPAAAATR